MRKPLVLADRPWAKQEFMSTRFLQIRDQRMPLLVRSAKRLTSPTHTVLRLCASTMPKEKVGAAYWQSINDWSRERDEEKGTV